MRTALAACLALAPLAASPAQPAAPGQPAASNPQPDQPTQQAPAPSTTERIATEARRVAAIVETPVARRFLAAAADLPAITEPRTVWWNPQTREALTPDEAVARTPEQLDGFQQRELTEKFYYDTAYGTPVAYARAIDVAALHGFEPDGARIFDFGFGTAGHLRMLASLGAHVTGAEVLDLLRALYREPGDTGAIARAAAATPGPEGSLTLLYGRWPGDDPMRTAVAAGGPYDLIITKNTLKRGYIHPGREADPRSLIDLGVDDAAFVSVLHDALAPGGLIVIYNLYPAQNPPDQPYLPHATGECPFDRALIEQAGLEVVTFNTDDTPFAHQMATALGWDQHMDLDRDLFAMYTILRRPD